MGILNETELIFPSEGSNEWNLSSYFQTVERGSWELDRLPNSHPGIAVIVSFEWCYILDSRIYMKSVELN